MSAFAAPFAAIGMTDMAPSSRTLGMEILQMDPAAGTARVAFEGRPEFANPTGYIQGGFLSAMLDDVMGMMAMLKVAPRGFASTIDLHVHYLRPVRAGRVEVAARILDRGPSVMFAEAELFDKRNKISARARSSLAITALKLQSPTPEQQGSAKNG
jgi:uncharacterized protein (TIGR00369 family)